MRLDSTIDAGLRELGARERLSRISFDERGQQRSYQSQCKLLDEYKCELKKTYRAIARECHPDRTRDLSEKERQEREYRFKCISRAFEFLNELKVRPTRVVPRVRIVFFTSTNTMYSANTTSTTTW